MSVTTSGSAQRIGQRRRRGRGRRRLGFGDEVTLIEHLEELRRRILVCLAFWGAAFGAAYAVHAQIIAALTHPLPPGHRHIATFGVAEPFMMSVRVSAWTAFALCLPLVLSQAWGYLAPAFGTSSRRNVAAFSLAGAALLLVGMTFGYLVALPRSLAFLVGYDSGLYHVQIRAREYLSYACIVVVMCGLVFQLPVALLGLVRCRVLSAARIRGNRRVGYAAMCVLGVALPGVDPVTTAIEVAPLLVLYEATMFVAVRCERRWDRARALATEDDVAQPDDPTMWAA